MINLKHLKHAINGAAHVIKKPHPRINGVRKKTSSKKSRKAVAPAPQPLAQTTPPLPATLLNSAPVAPHVTMESGLLTIDGVHPKSATGVPLMSSTVLSQITLGWL